MNQDWKSIQVFSYFYFWNRHDRWRYPDTKKVNNYICKTYTSNFLSKNWGQSQLRSKWSCSSEVNCTKTHYWAVLTKSLESNNNNNLRREKSIVASGIRFLQLTVMPAIKKGHSLQVVRKLQDLCALTSMSKQTQTSKYLFF